MTDPDRIRKRLREVSQPKKMHIEIVWDHERAVWLAEATSLYQLFGSGLEGWQGPTTEAPTVKEALIKLAEELKL